MNKKCNFQLDEMYKNTYEDNGSEECYKCKNWNECKKKKLEAEITQILLDLGI